MKSSEFAEGLTVAGDYVWQLTWKNGTVYKRNLSDFSVAETYDLSGEGWGLAYDGNHKNLIMSDGTSKLQIRNTSDFSLIKTLEVKNQGKAVSSLNELEYFNGFVYANIWGSYEILKIDIETGEVVKSYDFKMYVDGISKEYRPEGMDVLNGIAHIKDDEFYITGKNYPVIWKFRLN